MDLFDLRQLLPLIVIGGSFAFTGTILYGAWLLGRYRGREERTPAQLADVEARLRRVEDLVGFTADAVERLESAQRHQARLPGDPSSSEARPPKRVTTPH